jgi:hypothetical protein
MPKLSLTFVLPSFVAPSPARMLSIIKFKTINMEGIDEGTKTTMEVVSIAVKVATKST